MEEHLFWKFEAAMLGLTVLFAVLVVIRQRWLDRIASEKVRRQIEYILELDIREYTGHAPRIAGATHEIARAPDGSVYAALGLEPRPAARLGCCSSRARAAACYSHARAAAPFAAG